MSKFLSAPAVCRRGPREEHETRAGFGVGVKFFGMIPGMKRLGPGGRVAVIFALLATACAPQFGPAAVQNGRVAYGEALATSADEQQLLNIVKMRFLDHATFLRVSSVTASLQFQTQGQISSNVTQTPFPLNLQGTATWEESPTITYQELTGSDYAQQLHSPIPAETCIALLQTWPATTLLPLVVREVNGIENVVDSIRLDDPHSPDGQEFLEVAALMEQLYERRELEWEIRASGDAGKKVEAALLLHAVQGQETAESARLLELLGLEAAQSGPTRFKIEYGLEASSPDSISISTRSVQGVLLFMALATEVPAPLVGAAVAAGPRGQNLPADSLLVRSRDDKPRDAAIAISHRGHWFYIADADLKSKASFRLSRILMKMQSAENTSGAPILTIPVN